MNTPKMVHDRPVYENKNLATKNSDPATCGVTHSWNAFVPLARSSRRAPRRLCTTRFLLVLRMSHAHGTANSASPGVGVLASRGGYFARSPRDHGAAGGRRAEEWIDGGVSRFLLEGWLESPHEHPQPTVCQSARDPPGRFALPRPKETPTCHSSPRSPKH